MNFVLFLAIIFIVLYHKYDYNTIIKIKSGGDFMDRLPFRQVHLDFHTSELMPDVGSEFSEEDFEEALKTGHISSITLFAKCHHGWSYFPSKVNSIHPTLKTNLLDRQLKVCERSGVRTQIYISVGIDEHKANSRPEFCAVIRGKENTLLGAHWHLMCLNNEEYLKMLEAETAEVMETFKGRFDGVFFDICYPQPCVCPSCIETMLKNGLDPENPDDVVKNQAYVYKKYTQRLNSLIAKYDKNMPVVYNCGNIPRNDRSIAYSNTRHLELESLPTGGWGYDHFPMSAAYVRVLGKEFLGMTGKFHKAWGEFGGFKHPNALIYETSLSLANGAKCSIGDQLHPLGKFEKATYRLIGKAYSQVELKEPWCSDVKAVTDVAVYTTYIDNKSRTNSPDIGANRILLEGHYLYNIIDSECDFSDYKVIIFPDCVEFDESLSQKVKAFISKGGKIILSGKSGLTKEEKFFEDFGVEFCGEDDKNNTYMIPTFDLQPNGIAPYLMYRRGYNIKTNKEVEIAAWLQDSYFNRSFRKFCSHTTTPNNPESLKPGIVISGNIAYIAWNIFDEYREQGALQHKNMVCYLLDRLLADDKTLKTDLGSNGVVTLMKQETKNRYVNHLLYAVTKNRGTVEVIEDAPEIIDTKVELNLKEKPKRVYMAPSGLEIPFKFENDKISFTVPCFKLHGMAVIDY